MHAKKQIGTQKTGGSGRLHEHTQHSAAIRDAQQHFQLCQEMGCPSSQQIQMSE